MKALLIAIIALALHLALGWAWGLGAGLAAGLWMGYRGVAVGAAGVALAWAGLIGYGYVVAAGATGEMTRVMGSLVGNMPPAAFVVLSLLVGALLGAAGGWVGAAARALVPARGAAREA